MLPLFAGPVINVSTDKASEEKFLAQYVLHKNQYLFYPAQYWPHKNHFAILNVLKEIKHEKKCNIKVVFTGSDKGNLSYLKQVVEKFNLSKDVYFLGFLDIEEVNILYRNALALVMPTFLGPTNMPLVEAMALKCPIICSDFEGHREQVGGHALFFNPRDYSQLKNHIIKVYENEEFRNQIIQEASDYYVTSPNKIEYCASQVVEICKGFQKILSTRVKCF